jgi:hypothetical protein
LSGIAVYAKIGLLGTFDLPLPGKGGPSVIPVDCLRYCEIRGVLE